MRQHFEKTQLTTDDFGSNTVHDYGDVIPNWIGPDEDQYIYGCNSDYTTEEFESDVNNNNNNNFIDLTDNNE